MMSLICLYGNYKDFNNHQDFKTFTQGFARKLIRTYYSMVMVRSQIWTTRLHEQSEVFIHHFPEKELIICTLLYWIDEPPTDREAVYELFKSEGEWASVNFLHEAKIPYSKRVQELKIKLLIFYIALIHNSKKVKVSKPNNLPNIGIWNFLLCDSYMLEGCSAFQKGINPL